MNPFGLLPPFGINDEYQLAEGQARARMLREEWRSANASRPQTGRPGIVKRIRAVVGRSTVRLGQRLAGLDTGPARIGVRAPETKPGC